MCNLKVVLFVSGEGANAKTYKPDRDETQWWSRRDALVRTVAALLYGPSTRFDTQRELILLFDKDLARMHMWLDVKDSERRFPSEQELVLLWRDAARSVQSGRSEVSRGGLKCVLHVHLDVDNSSMSSMEGKSKRELLEILQKSASLEFLREHKLNSSLAVALKKTNQTKLVNIWKLWQLQAQSKASNTKEQGKGEKLEQILSNLLERPDNGVKETIAATLHESSDSELPVWNQPCVHKTDSQLVLFLGAVRDMGKAEQRGLAKACRKRGVPLTKVRLGPVAEFTSKILTVVAFHHHFGVLWPAIQMLVDFDGQTNTKKRRIGSTRSYETQQSHKMHSVLFVPIQSSELTTELASRTRLLWCLVRCIVTGLWRSRLAGKEESTSALHTKLFLRFQDRVWLKLDYDTLVRSMAERHQAAPCEFQILHSIQQQLKQTLSKEQGDVATSDIPHAELVGHDTSQCFVMDMVRGSTDRNVSSVAKHFLSQDHNTDGHKAPTTTIVLMTIGETTPKSFKKAKKSLLETVETSRARVIPTRMFDADESCQDIAAATITMLQHIAYQNQLCGFLEGANVDNTISKKPRG